MNSQRCSFAACNEPVFAKRFCQRHYNRQLRYGTPGCPTCQKRDLDPYQKECLACIAADFGRLGHDPLDITAYRGTTKSIMCRCRKCGSVAGKRLGNLRTFGAQCGSCWAPRRAAMIASSRFTQEQVAEILDRAGWTLTGRYEGANTPVAAVCQGCGKLDKRRVGDTFRKLNEGTQQFGCLACVRKKFPPPWTVPLGQAVEEFLDERIEYIARWKGGQYPVDARCLECGYRPALH
jgi:hypothetical protein